MAATAAAATLAAATSSLLRRSPLLRPHGLRVSRDFAPRRSPVLMAEFFGHMREASAERVVIEDMEAAAFKAMLHFVYTDTVPELDRKLAGGVTVDTAATTLALAEQHNCSLLKAKCVDFIVSTPDILDAVVATEGYKHLEATCPAALTGIVISIRGRRN